MKYIMNLVPKTKGGPFQRGTLIHACLEAYHSGRSWKKEVKRFGEAFYRDTFAEERAIIGDIPKMVYALMDSYFHFYEDDDEERLATELHFDLPLTRDIYIEGYIDALTGTKKSVWSWEYKSFARMPDMDFLIFNMQSGIYSWAESEMGYGPEGTVWDIIKAKEPSVPHITEKTKKLSVAKLDSTPYAVERGIKQLGFNPDDYRTFIDSHNYNDFFYRHKVRVSPRVVKSIMRDTLDTARDIADHGEKRMDRNLNKTCAWCGYKPICQAALMGLDVDYIIKKQFEQRKEREDEEQEAAPF
jgi:hypothetical protein